MSSRNCLWIKLANTPGDVQFGIPSSWNSTNFIVAQDCYVFEKEDQGVWRYNVIKDEWHLFFQYPKLCYSLSVRSIAVDPKRHKVYLSGTENRFLICDTKTKRTNEVYEEIETKSSVRLSLCQLIIPSDKRYKQSMVVANGLLHSLDNSSISKANQCFTKTHAIRVKPDEMEYVADFDKVVKGASFYQLEGMFGNYLLLPNVILIHVPSQNIILLIGANCQYGPSVIWKYAINTKLWAPTGINPIWPELSSAVLTASENVVVIAGYDKTLCNKLYILNIEDPLNYTLNHCNIDCPVPDARNSRLSVTGGDVRCELLVIGWIRRLFKTESFSTVQLPPLYLMQSVVPWLSCEQLHWIYRSSGAHYAIQMHHIISSIEQK